MYIVLSRTFFRRAFPYIKYLSAVSKYKINLQITDSEKKAPKNNSKYTVCSQEPVYIPTNDESDGKIVVTIQTETCGCRMEYEFSTPVLLEEKLEGDNLRLCCPLKILYGVLTETKRGEIGLKYLRKKRTWECKVSLDSIFIPEKLAVIKKIPLTRTVTHATVDGRDLANMIDKIKNVSITCSARMDILLKSTYIQINNNCIQMEATNGGIFAKSVLKLDTTAEGNTSSIVVLTKHLQMLAEMLKSNYQRHLYPRYNTCIDVYLAEDHISFEIHCIPRWHPRNILVKIERSGIHFYSVFDKIESLPMKEMLFPKGKITDFFNSFPQAPDRSPDLTIALYCTLEKDHFLFQNTSFLSDGKMITSDHAVYFYPMKNIPAHLYELKDGYSYLCGKSGILLIVADSIKYALIPVKHQ